MARFVEVCRLEELPEGKPQGREVEQVFIAFVREGNAVQALSARCPHAAGPLHRGWVEEGELVCPLHRWRFRLSDGRCTTVRGNTIERFACEVRGETVWVAI